MTTILLIDDDVEKAFFLERNIHRRHPSILVQSFLNVSTATEQASMEEVALVIANGHSAQGNGIQEIERFHTAFPSIPIMVVTLRPDLEQKARNAGAAFFFDESEEQRIYEEISAVLSNQAFHK